jgi:hypothetical protein
MRKIQPILMVLALLMMASMACLGGGGSSGGAGTYNEPDYYQEGEPSDWEEPEEWDQPESQEEPPSEPEPAGGVPQEEPPPEPEPAGEVPQEEPPPEPEPEFDPSSAADDQTAGFKWFERGCGFCKVGEECRRVVLTVSNMTDADICAVYMVPEIEGQPPWCQKNCLCMSLSGCSTIPPGGEFEILGPVGLYDVGIEDCYGNLIIHEDACINDPVTLTVN